jgi:hypothetical protein
MLKRIPGWKQPVVKGEAGAEGEGVPVATSAAVMREPVLPALEDMTEMITKDGLDQ